MQTEDLIEHPSKPGRGPYRRRSLTEKRRIVQLCLQPGASVAGVALAHGANANLVRKWIAKYRSGQWGEETPSAKLLPVTVDYDPPKPPASLAATATGGTIEIELAGARLRIIGRADPGTLNAVLGALR